MKISKGIFVLAAMQLLLSYPGSLEAKKPHLLLLDTAHGTTEDYEPYITLASHTFRVQYMSIDTLLDSNYKALGIEHYDAIFFILSPSLLSNLSSSISEKVLFCIEQFSQKQHKLIGLFFPPVATTLRSMKPVFESIGVVIKPDSVGFLAGETQNSKYTVQPKQTRTFITMAQQFLGIPLERRMRTYHTSLALPTTGKTIDFFPATRGITQATMLPLVHKPYAPCNSLFPLGVYWYNAVRNNNIVISSSSIFNCRLSENFRICPLDSTIRRNMLTCTQGFFNELSTLFTSRKEGGLNVKKAQKAHTTMHAKSILLEKSQEHREEKQKHTFGWMDLTYFDGKKHVKKQHELLDYIFDCGLTHLWVRFLPNWYYSPIGEHRNKHSSHFKSFHTSVKTFAHMLKTYAHKRKALMPKILVGMELATNLHGKNLPKKAAADMYGTTYADLPQALNHTFWNNEIIIPLKQFAHDWNKLAEGVPLSGVVLDLEFYMRKKSGFFSSTMGFEPETLTSFISKYHLPQFDAITPHDVTSYLSDNGLLKKYYAFLTEQSSKLGQTLREVFTRTIPGGMIACYAMTLSQEWFYRGLYRGLSPLELLTFNSEFTVHKNSLEKHGINARHSSVFMLSKLQSEHDISRINQLLKRHDGIWLNRINKIVEPRNKHDLEQDGLSDGGRKTFARHLHTLLAEKPI